MEVSIYIFFFTKEPAKAKQFLPFLQRAGRSSGIVEVSGSLTRCFRMKGDINFCYEIVSYLYAYRVQRRDQVY